MKKWNIEIKETKDGLLIAAPFIPDSDELTPAEWAIKESVAFIAYALAAAATTADYVAGAKNGLPLPNRGSLRLTNKCNQLINKERKKND